jgi:hypothetical protein
MSDFLDEVAEEGGEGTGFGEVKEDLAEINFRIEPEAWVGVEVLRTMFHPYNSQVRWEYQQEAIAASIRDYGFTSEPIVVNQWNNKIVSGHGRVEVCWNHGYRGELPVIYLNLESEEEHRNAMLRFNKARGQQDPIAEHREVMALLDVYGQEAVMINLAMRQEDIDQLLGLAGDKVLAPDGFDEYDENLETQYCCPKCGYNWSGKPK